MKHAYLTALSLSLGLISVFSHASCPSYVIGAGGDGGQDKLYINTKKPEELKILLEGLKKQKDGTVDSSAGFFNIVDSKGMTTWVYSDANIRDSPDAYKNSADPFISLVQCLISDTGEKANANSNNTAQNNSGSVKRKQANNKSIKYYDADNSCLKQGASPTDGRATFTNICNSTVNFGYCNRDKTEISNDPSVCEANPSEFSPSGYNYVQQSGALKPGEMHTQAFVYQHQSVFIVACRYARHPLIESHTNHEAHISCWSFK
jgi:hypothetical protein